METFVCGRVCGLATTLYASSSGKRRPGSVQISGFIVCSTWEYSTQPDQNHEAVLLVHRVHSTPSRSSTRETRERSRLSQAVRANDRVLHVLMCNHIYRQHCPSLGLRRQRHGCRSGGRKCRTDTRLMSSL